MRGRLLFCHGMEAGPVGRKSEALRAEGWDVVAPDGRGLELRARIEGIAAAIDEQAEAPIVVGSSLGGLAALVACAMVSRAPRGLVLAAPALMLPAPPGTPSDPSPPPRTIIVHGVRDEIVPIDLSRRFAARHGVRLVEVDDDHRLYGAGMAAILAALDEL